MNFHSSKNDDQPAAPSEMWLLYSGIKNLLRCDEAEVVQGIARYVIQQYDSLRIGAAYVERKRNTAVPLIATFLGAATRFLEVRENKDVAGAVWIARLANEKRAIEKIIPLLPELNWSELQLRRPPTLAALGKLPAEIFPLRRRIFKLARLLLRGNQQFFKVLRVAEMIGYYAAYRSIFQKADYRLAVMSSHSNPHGIAFNLAARRCGIPTILISHGMPVRPVARLSYDLAIVHCEAAKRIYIEEGCRFKRFIIHGRKQNYAPMPEIPLPDALTVGIFLCKDVNELKLQNLVALLLENPRIARILIRPHPKNLYLGLDDWITELDNRRVEKTIGDSLFNDLSQTDIVLGGNSSVLIETVTAGKPSGYVAGLDYGATDFHQFVADRLIYSFEFESVCDFDEMQRFYRRADWLNVLRFYANLDEEETQVNNRVADAIRRLIKV